MLDCLDFENIVRMFFDMNIESPIFVNYVGYHQGKEHRKRKDYFRSFQWKNALPSGAKVY